MIVSRHPRRPSLLPLFALSFIGAACGSSATTPPPASATGCDNDASHPSGDGGGVGQDAGANNSDAGGGNTDAGGTLADGMVLPEGAAPAESGAPGVLGFTPSNVSVSANSSVGDLVISDPNYSIDTSAMKIDCVKPGEDGGVPYAFSSAMQSDGSQVTILYVHSVIVQQGAAVSVKGAPPLVLVATTTVSIQGTVQSATPGNAGGPQVTQSGAGGGPGGGADGNHAGAGGGGYCGTGGPGAPNDDATAPAAGGRSYGSATLVPLIGGSAGGNHGDYNDGGEGGGAIQISAGTSITLGSVGVLNVPGYGGANTGGGGGILLEAPQVTIDGIVAANGGGAGLGTPNSSGAGQTGQPSAQPAAGGAATEGVGGAGTMINGTAGTYANGHAGSGGGAAGRIRINTTSGAATLGSSAIVSPAMTTTCTTQGMLAK
ncbi:MAG TPA: hypothetical protein VKU41_28815 [Polyangiaceae bacterium]|nr:hypothetical protein [Polyangiaceae bacterium]